jgi:hypothetical protein
MMYCEASYLVCETYDFNVTIFPDRCSTCATSTRRSSLAGAVPHATQMYLQHHCLFAARGCPLKKKKHSNSVHELFIINARPPQVLHFAIKPMLSMRGRYESISTAFFCSYKELEGFVWNTSRHRKLPYCTASC